MHSDAKHMTPTSGGIDKVPEDKCRVCGKVVRFDIEPVTGALVASNRDGTIHEHQRGA